MVKSKDNTAEAFTNMDELKTYVLTHYGPPAARTVITNGHVLRLLYLHGPRCLQPVQSILYPLLCYQEKSNLSSPIRRLWKRVRTTSVKTANGRKKLTKYLDDPFPDGSRRRKPIFNEPVYEVPSDTHSDTSESPQFEQPNNFLDNKPVEVIDLTATSDEESTDGIKITSRALRTDCPKCRNTRDACAEEIEVLKSRHKHRENLRSERIANLETLLQRRTSLVKAFKYKLAKYEKRYKKYKNLLKRIKMEDPGDFKPSPDSLGSSMELTPIEKQQNPPDSTQAQWGEHEQRNNSKLCKPEMSTASPSDSSKMKSTLMRNKDRYPDLVRKYLGCGVSSTKVPYLVCSVLFDLTGANCDDLQCLPLVQGIAGEVFRDKITVKQFVNWIKNRIFDISFCLPLTETKTRVSAVYGDDVVAERTARDWFARFRRNHFDVIDARRFGRPVKMDEDQLKELWRAMAARCRELSEKINYDFATIAPTFSRWVSLGSLELRSSTDSPENKSISGFPSLLKISLDTK